MVFAAIAQAFAFNYKPFMECEQRGGPSNHPGVKGHKTSGNNTQIMVAPSALRTTGNVIKNIGYVLNVKDVITDAHSTFMKGDEKDTEQELQLEDIMKKNKPFTWSDDEDDVVQRSVEAI